MEMIFMTYTCVFMILRCVSGVSKGWVYQFTQEKCKVENMKKKHWMLLVHHWMLLVPDFRQCESSLRDSMDWNGKSEHRETIDLAMILWGFPVKFFPNQSIEPWFTVIFHYENPKIH